MNRLTILLGRSISMALLVNACVLPDNFRAVDATVSGNAGRAGSTSDGGMPSTTTLNVAGNAGQTMLDNLGGLAGSAPKTNASGAAGHAIGQGGSIAGGTSSGAAGSSGSSQGGVSGATMPGNGGAGTAGAATGGTSAATGGISAAGMSAGGTNSGGSSSTLLASCVLLLHLDESAWNGTAAEVRDSSGSGNHGTAVNGITTGEPAKFSKAGQFNASGYVSLGDDDSLRPTNALTVATWIYPTALDGGATSAGIVAKRWGYGDRTAFTLFIWTEDRLFADIETENDRFQSTFQFTSNAWHHVVLVFDGTLASAERARIYVNGALDSVHAETSSSISPYDSPLDVGQLRNGGNPFAGAIDEVAIWRRALTADEIRVLYLAVGPI